MGLEKPSACLFTAADSLLSVLNRLPILEQGHSPYGSASPGATDNHRPGRPQFGHNLTNCRLDIFFCKECVCPFKAMIHIDFSNNYSKDLIF